MFGEPSEKNRAVSCKRKLFSCLTRSSCVAARGSGPFPIIARVPRRRAATASPTTATGRTPGPGRAPAADTTALAPAPATPPTTDSDRPARHHGNLLRVMLLSHLKELRLFAMMSCVCRGRSTVGCLTP